MVRKTLLFIMLILLISCDEKIKTNSLILAIDAVVQNTDSVNAYYTNSNSIEFTDTQSFWTKIKGSKKNQKIKIVFPDSIKPKQIRLDFGQNQRQSEIVLNKFTFIYRSQEFSVKGKEIFYIFREDQNNTVANKLIGIIKRKEPKQINGPSLYPNGDKLFKKLDQLYSLK